MICDEGFARREKGGRAMRRYGRRGRVRDEIAISAGLQMIDGVMLLRMRVARCLGIGCAHGREQRFDARMFERLRCDGREREQQDRAYRSEPADLPDDAPTQVMHADTWTMMNERLCHAGL